MSYQVSRVKQYYNKWHRNDAHGQKRRMVRLPFSRREDNCYSIALRLLDIQVGKKLLDIACGCGYLLARAENLGLHCYGIDISEVAISEARKRVKGKLICSDVNNGLPYNDNFFDYITCLGSLEHFENQSGMLRDIPCIQKILPDLLSCTK